MLRAGGFKKAGILPRLGAAPTSSWTSDFRIEMDGIKPGSSEQHESSQM